MSLLRRSTLAAAVVVAMAAPLAVPASPAQAAPRTRTVSTAGQGGAGYASMTLTYNFVSRKRVVLKGTVNDKCPGNSYGAYGNVRINYLNGGGRNLMRNDVDGCGNGGNRFSRAFGGANSPRIASISFDVSELDCGRGPACVVGPSKYSGIIYNPR